MEAGRTRAIVWRDERNFRKLAVEPKTFHDLPRPRPHADSRSNLCKLGGCLIYIDLNVWVAREGNGARKTANAASTSLA